MVKRCKKQYVMQELHCQWQYVLMSLKLHGLGKNNVSILTGSYRTHVNKQSEKCSHCQIAINTVIWVTCKYLGNFHGPMKLVMITETLTIILEGFARQ